MGTPVADYVIDADLVSRLLSDQHPDLAHLPLQAVDAGWDNAMFRLGDQLAVRLPRRAAVARLIIHEQQWLPELSKRLSLPVPAPYRIGRPGLGYPCSWSVTSWLSGLPADLRAPDASQAASLGRFLRSLHLPAPAEAPPNPVRGVPLAQRAAVVEARMQRLAGRSALITEPIMRLWKKALSSPVDRAPTWLHGDLHPRNVLVQDGAITGVIDWGDLTAGDCATDLASLWMLFTEAAAQQEALAAYGNPSEATVHRAIGWAIVFAVMLLDTGIDDNPRNAAIGERILRFLTKRC
ncbi:MAG TPA: aminoglycoside phosphotransferase family protein [Verrucomicrobiae bacterium]|nr:aminoglycoside phosphotransferase family protein [Verrucomicrobiae bacterium]